MDLDECISDFQVTSSLLIDELNEKLLDELDKAFGYKAGAPDLQVIAEFDIS
jgi:hypothetical protein